jgi:tripartite-type tricarboxylate transporter receptor subunit TctC
MALAAVGTLHAQTAYPSKPVKIVVPVTTGGPSDLVARILGDKLSAALGKPVVIENRPGASQTVGANAVAKADPRWLHAAAGCGQHGHQPDPDVRTCRTTRSRISRRFRLRT